MKSRYLSDDELLQLRSAMSLEAWLPFALSLETGLRVGDVVALPTDALSGCTLRFTASKTGKDGISHVSVDLAAAIRAHASRLWLFPSPYKPAQHLTRAAVWRRIKAAARRAGVDLDGCSPHSCRKVFAVRLTREYGMKAAQEALQHDRISTTEEYALSDWSTGENAELPLLRRDLPVIVQKVVDMLRISR